MTKNRQLEAIKQQLNALDNQLNNASGKSADEIERSMWELSDKMDNLIFDLQFNK